MTATVTDLFCGAGGSSTGAAAAGLEIVMAANHWQTAIDVHQVHHPGAAHDCADITQVDPRRYPRTDVLLASPECTNHSQARGISRKRQDPSLWDAPDPSAERSRATMWDVVRFAEQMAYDVIVVENVVEATKWVLWSAWVQALTDLGYEMRLLSHNSMHHGVAQSRDRIYVVWARKGLRIDLELELTAWCPRCDAARPVRQQWKRDRWVGRYRQQYVWGCTTCGAACEPATEPAASIIDWGLPCPRIGDRARPLATATRARILAGLQRYGWAPVITAGAGNVYETTPGNRARPLTDPLRVQTGTAEHALAVASGTSCSECATGDPRGVDPGPWHSPWCSMSDVPDGFLVQTAHGAKDGKYDASRVRDVGDPLWTVTASDDRPSLILANNFDNVPTSTSSPLPTATTGNRHGLVVPLRRNGRTRPAEDEPLGTVAAGGERGGIHHALLMRNNTARGDHGYLSTPVTEPTRALTGAGHQSLLVPYNRTGHTRTTDEPMATVTTRDRAALVDPDRVVDDCGFRMLEPHEIAAAMAFPEGYIPDTYTKRDRVKLAGNAVTPPVMTWITGRVLQALEAAGLPACPYSPPRPT